MFWGPAEWLRWLERGRRGWTRSPATLPTQSAGEPLTTTPAIRPKQPVLQRMRGVAEKSRPTPERPPIAARARTYSAGRAVHPEKHRLSSESPRSLEALNFPEPLGAGSAAEERPRCGERCSWICPTVIILVARRYAAGQEPTPRCLLRSSGCSAGQRVGLGPLPRPPGSQGAGRALLAVD